MIQAAQTRNARIPNPPREKKYTPIFVSHRIFEERPKVFDKPE